MVTLSPFDDPPPPKQGRGHLLTEKRVIETKPDLRNRETWGNLHFQHLQSGIKFFLLVVFYSEEVLWLNPGEECGLPLGQLCRYPITSEKIMHLSGNPLATSSC